MMMLLKKIEKATRAFFGEYGRDDEYVYCVFVMNNLEKEVKVKVQDMDFDEINFADVNSISESMRNDARNIACIRYAQDFVDTEDITGVIGIDLELATEEGEIFNVANCDVNQLHDILRMTSFKNKVRICKSLLERVE